MKNFGFAPRKGRVIDYDRNDRRVYEYVLEHDPSYALCIGCGGCAATCTAAGFIPFSLRKVNILLRRGENSEVRKEISRCMLCGKCTLVCPRGVNTRNAVFLIREAFEKFDNYAL